MNKNILEGSWKELSGHAKEKWAMLTDNELQEIDGKRDILEGLIQKRYGISQENASKQIDEWAHKIKSAVKD